MPRLRFTVRRMMVAVAIAGVAMLLVRVAIVMIDVMPTDVVPRLFGRDRSTYANGYRDGNFGSVKVRMTPEEVIRLIGRPLGGDQEARKERGDAAWQPRWRTFDTEVWTYATIGYSEPEKGTTFWEITVTFVDNKVVAMNREFIVIR